MAYVANIGAIAPDGVWSETINLFDQNTGDSINLTGCSFKMSFREEGCASDDCGWWNGVGSIATSDAGNITILGIGYIGISFQLRCGNYSILLEVSRDGFDVPVLTGTLNISSGLR